MASRQRPELLVVGAGIVGLAHAWMAVRRGWRVRVLDRDAQANAASVRNFGFVTVTGQQQGRVWQLAQRSAQLWRELAPQAGIEIAQQGLVLVAQRPEAEAVCREFLETEMARDCDWLTPAQLAAAMPFVRAERFCGGLRSRADLRVDSRTAIPKLAGWLQVAHGVGILRGVTVHGVDGCRLATSAGDLRADAVIVCPGDDVLDLFPQLSDSLGMTRCKLQMLRLAPAPWTLSASLMSDLSLVRYLGYAERDSAAGLLDRLRQDKGAALDRGIHLIVVQNRDGSLVVGDSHDYAQTPSPFLDSETERLILEEYTLLLGTPPPVLERWSGTYAAASGHSVVHALGGGAQLVVVTSGTGASTGFALAEQVVTQLTEGLA